MTRTRYLGATTYTAQLARAIGARFYCIACGRPSHMRRLMCDDCHDSAERREPGPWRLARRAARAKGEPAGGGR